MSQINLKITLQPKQRLALNQTEISPITFFGGSKGGGKSYLVRARQVIRRLKYPNTRGLIIRKTYPELLANHIRMFWKEYPETKNWYNKSEKTIYWPNGSTTEFSYLQGEDDVYTYQGREYEDIDVDEVTQHKFDTIKILRSSLRTTNPNIKPRMFLTGNPGGIGHSEVKRMFIDRNFKENENPDDYAFIPAKVQDNKILMENNPEYVKQLQDLPEHLRRAYLDGDWNIFAGLAFSELKESIHLIDPIELPEHTRYFAGFDLGFNHPYAFVLMAVVPEGTVYVVNQSSGRLLTTPEVSQRLANIVGDKKVMVYAGVDMWSRSRSGSPAPIEEYMSYCPKNITWVKAHTDRVQGVFQIRKYIKLENGIPKLYFFKNCRNVYDNVSSMQFSENNPEDVLKMDAVDGVGGDDFYDALRYGLMSRAYPMRVPDEPPKRNTGEELLQIINKQSRIRRNLGVI